MSGKQLSYDYQNTKRDLGDVFIQVIKSKPVLAELLRVSDRPAKHTKHEWIEDIVSPLSWTLGANYTAASGSMTVTNTGMKVGDILQFEKVTTGVRSTLLAKVASLVSTTGITLTVYGGSADENLSSGATITLVSRPKNEGTDATADDGYEPSVEYNYTQIMDRTAKLSKTSLEVEKYGIGDALNYQVERQLQDIAYELANTILNQARVARSSSEAGTMGGIMWFLQQASGNDVDASGAAVTQTILNNAFEIARKNGATNINLMVCHPIQMRKISAFNVSGTNPNIERRDTTTGSYVTTYVSDQGDIVPLLVDRNMDKDKIALLDMSKIALVPLQNRQFTDEDATPAGADYVARRILGEYTLEVKNAANSHAFVYGLQAT